MGIDRGTFGSKPLTFRLPKSRPLLVRDLFIISMYSFLPIPNNRKPAQNNPRHYRLPVTGKLKAPTKLTIFFLNTTNSSLCTVSQIWYLYRVSPKPHHIKKKLVGIFIWTQFWSKIKFHILPHLGRYQKSVTYNINNWMNMFLLFFPNKDVTRNFQKCTFS